MFILSVAKFEPIIYSYNTKVMKICIAMEQLHYFIYCNILLQILDLTAQIKALYQGQYSLCKIRELFYKDRQ